MAKEGRLNTFFLQMFFNIKEDANFCIFLNNILNLIIEMLSGILVRGDEVGDFAVGFTRRRRCEDVDFVLDFKDFTEGFALFFKIEEIEFFSNFALLL